ncbi:MAG: hypothetical protein RMK57_11875 [Bryobacterales bacterium]|nr:hypothetical protein [Bryobacteraceae bacterium]MDW8355218.1 hypothetical protein [Bryobacterales bacterium]
MTPAQPQPPAAPEAPATAEWKAPLLLRLAGATIALMAGLALLILPWVDSWEQNYFANFGAGWKTFWMNSYFRGAVSGLGAANLYVALADLLWLRRCTRPN